MTAVSVPGSAVKDSSASYLLAIDGEPHLTCLQLTGLDRRWRERGFCNLCIWCVRQGQRSGRRGFMRPRFGFMRPGFGALRSQLLHRAGQRRVDEPSPRLGTVRGRPCTAAGPGASGACNLCSGAQAGAAQW